MKKRVFQGISFLLMTAMVCQGGITAGAKSKAKAKLSTKKIVLQVKQSKKIKITGKNKKAKYIFKSSNKKVVKVSSKGVVKALKPGTAKITVKETYKKKTKKVGTVTVRSRQKCILPPPKTAVPTVQPSAVPTQTPPASVPQPPATVTETPAATVEPPLELKPITYDVPSGFDEKQDGVAYGKAVRESYFSDTTGKYRKVNIILPPDYTEEKEYPVLYLLHGIGGDENEWLDGNPAYVVGNLVAEGLAKDMIIVIPNCRARANDAATTEFSLEHYKAFDNFINDLRDNLMPYMEDNYSIATGRKNTAIAGLSMGGRESLNIGLHMPETFGYIAAFSPGFGVFAYEANGVKEDGLFTEETFRLPEEYKDHTLLMLNNGISEGGENALGGQCHKVFEKNEIPHLFYVTEGGHDFKVWKHGLYNFALQIFQ